MENTQRLKKRSALIAGVIILGILALVLRDRMSRRTEKAGLAGNLKLQPEKSIASKIYVNIFPLFVEAKDLKVLTKKWRKLLLTRGSRHT